MVQHQNDIFLNMCRHMRAGHGSCGDGSEVHEGRHGGGKGWQGVEALPLPIAGLMCDLPVEEAQFRIDAVKKAAYEQGVNRGIDPFMTLSFASLPVIPALRLTTLGVVDVNKFQLIG